MNVRPMSHAFDWRHVGFHRLGFGQIAPPKPENDHHPEVDKASEGIFTTREKARFLFNEDYCLFVCLSCKLHHEHSHDSKDNTPINGTKLQISGTWIMAPGSVLGDSERQTPTSHHLPWPWHCNIQLCQLHSLIWQKSCILHFIMLWCWNCQHHHVDQINWVVGCGPLSLNSTWTLSLQALEWQYFNWWCEIYPDYVGIQGVYLYYLYGTHSPRWWWRWWWWGSSSSELGGQE